MLQSRRDDLQEEKSPKPTLGRKLALILLPLVLLPMVGIGTAAYLRTQSILRQESLGQMTFALSNQVAEVGVWFLEKENLLQNISEEQALTSEIIELSQNPGDSATIERVQEQLLTQLRLNIRGGFGELLILERGSGRVISASNANYLGEVISLPDPFNPGGTQTIPVVEHPAFSPETVSFLTIASFPEGNDQIGEFLIAAIIDKSDIASMLDDLKKFWPVVDDQGSGTGRTLLVIPPSTTLESTLVGTSFDKGSLPAHPVFENQSVFDSSSTTYNAAPGEVHLTTFQWLKGRSIGVVVERPQQDILAGLINIAPILGLMILIAIALTILTIVIVTNRMLQPLTSLAEFARRMSRGDWQFRVPVDQDEDLGGLASSLNRMAEELGQLYLSLEQRVEDRTQQIQIASEIARAVISIPNLDELLRQGVRLIKQRFGYDHVSIFLLDREGTNAILRETSSDDNEALKTIGHKLKVGSKSVVGWVTETNVPRLSSDFPAGTEIELDELLPGARSEVAIPLQVAGNPLGALAIQSMQANAFKREDIEVLQTLADQLSAAIKNVRLAQESTNAAERARLVSEITAQISGLMEPEKILQVTAQALHKALGDAEIMIRLAPHEEELLQREE